MSGLDVVTRFIADTGGLEAGADKAAKAVEGFGGSTLAAVAGPLALATGVGVAVGAVVAMTSAAAADRDEQAKLETAIRASGAATGDWQAQIEGAITAGQALGFTDSQTRDAMQSLVTATGDVGKATELMATAQDVARFANVDLATASDAVAKAAAGQATQLTRLIPGLEKGKSASDTLAAAQKAAAGQAEEFASTTEGQMAIANDAFGELQEEIGSAFLPIIDALVPALVPVIDTLGVLIKAVMPVLIPLVKLLAAALVLVVDALVKVIDWVVKAISWLGPKLQPVLNAVMDVAGKVAGALGGIGSALSGMIDWIGRAIDAVGRLLDKLNPLKDFKMPSLPSLPFAASLAPAAAGPGATTRAGGARAQTAGTVVVNIYGGDPRRTEQAVRDAFRHWRAVEGTTAPDREW